MRGEILVDAARVGGEGSTVGGRHGDIGSLGDSTEAQPSRLAVGFEHLGSEDLGQLARVVAAEEVHLEDSLLCGYVPLHEERVLEAVRFDVRNTERVEGDRGGGGDRRV